MSEVTDFFALEFDLSKTIFDGREILTAASRSPLERLRSRLILLDYLAELGLLPLSLASRRSASDLLMRLADLSDIIGLNSSAPGFFASSLSRYFC
jgi:hypothetical protein